MAVPPAASGSAEGTLRAPANGMLGSVTTLIAAVIAALLAAPTAAASMVQDRQNADTRESAPPTIQVDAEATITAPPDQVEINIGVKTQADESRVAAERNAAQLSRVLDALKARWGRVATFETRRYSLMPEYRYPEDGGKPTISGYTASNVIRVTLNDLDAVGEVIDTAVSAGANQVRDVQYKLKDPESARARALRSAARQAQSEANALAAALGVKIVGIVSVSESPSGVRPVEPVQALSAERSAAPSTPIEQGPITIDARIVLVVEIQEQR